MSGPPDGSPWIDLSRCISSEMPKLPLFPAPVIRLLSSRPNDPANVTALDLACHVGTHIDAPRHFIDGGRTIDEIPLDRLYGTGVVWNIPSTPFHQISVADLEAAQPRCRADDIVFLYTGWESRWGDPSYDDHPYLSDDAATWLVAQQVKMVGVDFGTPDLPVVKRPPGFNWPVHQILLGHDVLVAEHLAGLAQLANHRCELMVMAISIKGADGAPARVLGRRLPEN